MSAADILGLPLDLLAHWMFQQSHLYRDLYEAKRNLEDWQRQESRYYLRDTDKADFLALDSNQAKQEMVDKIYQLEWCEAEASYWVFRLELEANALVRIEAAIKPPAPESLSLNDVKRVQIYCSQGKVFDSDDIGTGVHEIVADMVESDPGLLGVVIRDRMPKADNGSR